MESAVRKLETALKDGQFVSNQKSQQLKAQEAINVALREQLTQALRQKGNFAQQCQNIHSSLSQSSETPLFLPEKSGVNLLIAQDAQVQEMTRLLKDYRKMESAWKEIQSCYVSWK